MKSNRENVLVKTIYTNTCIQYMCFCYMIRLLLEGMAQLSMNFPKVAAPQPS